MHQCPIDTDMAEIELHRFRASCSERGEHQRYDLDIALRALVSEQLGPELHRRPALTYSGTACAQNRTGVTQAHGAGALQSARVDPRHLGCHVSMDAECAATERVDELEGLLIELVTGSGQQRLEVLDDRRVYDVVPPASVEVQKLAAQSFNTSSRRRQNFLNALRQHPQRLCHASNIRSDHQVARANWASSRAVYRDTGFNETRRATRRR